MASRITPVLLATVLVAPACGTDDAPPATADTDVSSSSSGTGADSGSGTAGEVSVPFSVVTYNIGLAFGYVAEATARKDAVASAIIDSDADVMCVQELWPTLVEGDGWSDAVIDELLAQTAETFPHQYWVRTVTSDDTPPTGCTIEESEPLEECLVENCSEVSPENLTDCVLDNCAAEFGATSAGCMNCLAAHLGEPFEDIVAACKGVFSSGVLFDGHNGLAILSRHPLLNTESTDMDFALTTRSALRATVAPEGAEPVDLYCTHLAADLGDVIAYPPDGTYGSFGEENAGQSATVISWVEQTATSPTVLVTGDFNHGPMVGTGLPELAANYQLFIEAGYADPVVESGAFCTFCDSNTFIMPGTGDVLIDHVYIKGAAEVQGASVVYDETVSLMTADGSTQMLHRSDHFGVRVDLLH